MIIIERRQFPRIPSYISLGIAHENDFDKDDVAKLHAIEYNKFKSLKNSKRKKEFLVSRMLMKKLAEEKNYPLSYIDYHPKNKAPYGHSGESDTKWQLSVSHCKGIVCCALSDSSHAVGVDIEPKNRTITPRLKKRFLQRRELELAKKETPIKLWTLKEAVVKLLKTGMRTNLNSFEIIQYDTDYYRAHIERFPEICVLCIPFERYFIAVAYFTNQ